jgi:hypothetical protein
LGECFFHSLTPLPAKIIRNGYAEEGFYEDFQGRLPVIWTSCCNFSAIAEVSFLRDLKIQPYLLLCNATKAIGVAPAEESPSIEKKTSIKTGPSLFGTYRLMQPFTSHS